MFTGKQLAAFCEKVYAGKWVYWYGTCGYECTESLYKSKKKQYLLQNLRFLLQTNFLQKSEIYYQKNNKI